MVINDRRVFLGHVTETRFFFCCCCCCCCCFFLGGGSSKENCLEDKKNSKHKGRFSKKKRYSTVNFNFVEILKNING